MLTLIPIPAQPNGSIVWNRPHMQAWESFTVTSAGHNKIHIRSVHGKFVSAQPNGSLQCNRARPLAWETFHVRYL
jgi:hypothetical protein